MAPTGSNLSTTGRPLSTGTTGWGGGFVAAQTSNPGSRPTSAVVPIGTEPSTRLSDNPFNSHDVSVRSADHHSSDEGDGHSHERRGFAETETGRDLIGGGAGFVVVASLIGVCACYNGCLKGCCTCRPRRPQHQRSRSRRTHGSTNHSRRTDPESIELDDRSANRSNCDTNTTANPVHGRADGAQDGHQAGPPPSYDSIAGPSIEPPTPAHLPPRGTVRAKSKPSLH